jgi:selenocysteine lyase/cysteine desulfurase
VDNEGFIDVNELERILRAYNQEEQHGKKRIRLVAVSGASNVLGVFNDLREISRIVHLYDARLLVDAAQLVAHRKVAMQDYGIDYLAFSAHKVYAPFGSGALVVRKGLLHFSPGEMELIQSSGEENAGGIAATGKALLLLQRIGLELIQEEEQTLTGRALRGLAEIPGVKVYGIKDPDSPRFAQKGGVIVFDIKNILPGRVAKELAEQGGIGVRYGCHCAHLLIKRMVHVHPLLEQLQGLILILAPKLSLPGLVRVSFGIENIDEEVDKLILILDRYARQSQAGKDNPFASTQTKIQEQMDDYAKAVSLRVFTLSMRE